MSPRLRIEFWVCSALGAALILGCSLHRAPKKLANGYSAQWQCEIDAVNAKTGKPSEMRCTDPEGQRFKVRAE